MFIIISLVSFARLRQGQQPVVVSSSADKPGMEINNNSVHGMWKEGCIK